MRYLLYYPMIHVSDQNQIGFLRKFLSSELASNLTRDQFAQIQNLADIDSYNEVWLEFLNYLRKQPAFNRFYSEAYGKKTRPFVKPGSGMGKCYDYLRKSGAQFMATESAFYSHGAHSFKSLSSIGLWFTKQRERVVVENINKSLLEGERGLLLFGGGHKNALIERFENTDIYLEIFE